jgi:PAS domain S-box-containing protein
MQNDTPSARIIAIFVILAATFGLSALALFSMQRIIQGAERDYISQESVVYEVQDTLSTMKDAETGQRGFLLTGDPSYLSPYLDAKSQIEKNLNNLDLAVAAGRLPAEAVKNYRSLAEAKFKELDETVNLRRTQGFDAALAIVSNDSGKEIMDRMRALTDELVSESDSVVAGKRHTVQELSSSVLLLLCAVGLLTFSMLIWAYRRVRNEIKLREAATLESQRQGELLKVTLASIGDGVIATDASGRITFINEVAERLTGWSSQQAVGTDCDAVFNIVNETSRQPVESPVAKVIKSGIVVGLANHTVLIRRDGTEIPIDDSGAPIRESDGSLRGVILVFRDFTEHKEAEAALRSAMEEARSANIAKDNFLATLSHELRTPLTPVVMTMAAWLSNGELPGGWRDDVEMMQRNLELEARLIDDLLDLTRIVRGKLSLNSMVSDINELLNAVARMHQSEVSAKGQRLSLDLDAASHYAYVDPARLQQVFLNVLKNATKFTPEGGSIHIWTENDEEKLRINIRDTGVGMTDEVRQKLFRPFEQGTDEIVRRYGGLGLGMAISKALLEMQRGSIRAASDGPGTGSTFCIEIPAAEAQEAGFDPMQFVAPPSAQRSYNILLVEDHIDTSRALSRLLERDGHQVTSAFTIEDAIGHLKQESFDLILSDIGLPDGTGLDLIRKARAISAAPAIALTGFGMEEDVRSCREAGFNDHLTKPINFQRLESIITQLMRNGHRAA